MFPYDQTYAADQVLKQVLTSAGRDRRGPELGLPGGRQDRHRREPRQRLVRRLHAAALDRRLGRLPAGQHPDRPTASAAPTPARSGRTTWSRRPTATAATGRAPPVPFAGTAFTGPHSSSGPAIELDRRRPPCRRPARRRRPAGTTTRDDHAGDDTGDRRAANTGGGGGTAPAAGGSGGRPRRRRRRRRPDRRRHRLTGSAAAGQPR